MTKAAPNYPAYKSMFMNDPSVSNTAKEILEKLDKLDPVKALKIANNVAAMLNYKCDEILANG